MYEMLEWTMKGILKIWAALRALGPYLMIELLLPGGTILALLLWLSQRFARKVRAKTQGASSSPSQGAAVLSGESRQVAHMAGVKPLGTALR